MKAPCRNGVVHRGGTDDAGREVRATGFFKGRTVDGTRKEKSADRRLFILRLRPDRVCIFPDSDRVERRFVGKTQTQGFRRKYCTIGQSAELNSDDVSGLAGRNRSRLDPNVIHMNRGRSLLVAAGGKLEAEGVRRVESGDIQEGQGDDWCGQ